MCQELNLWDIRAADEIDNLERSHSVLAVVDIQNILKKETRGTKTNEEGMSAWVLFVGRQRNEWEETC